MILHKIVPVAVTALLLISSCKSTETITKQQMPELPAFDTEGHRGARGLMPENSIPAMMKALELGVTTLEMDCHVTKDGKVVVTHDPYINPLYARTPDGKDITKEESQNYAIYQMDYDQVRRFEMGTKFYDTYPHQQKVKTYIPLLAELIDSVQNHIKANNLPQVFYNIETKSVANGDNTIHPEPAVFVKKLVEVLEEKKITEWAIVQSFDPRTLKVLHEQYPNIRASLLVSNKDSFEENIERLGFTPVVYSPNYKLVTPELIAKAHEKNIKVIPWTVNTAEDIARLKAMGVDGIISDYPNMYKELQN
ncbi:glycerophosphodiester phosphodiesterase family protein [Pontibacter fetidus]|uniref:Glycerophosphodiester phosphodiesterase n=1 Tax=Pontibacter fetidus TaxID=2700082 RepID=A0A6B2HB10_9BACT|nr:glycerophosphodiester phosphodiesterase family protein [Pontibacter fetidus]NDK57002.1 glycerophosphodiester phosphodiesterase [Pontibacter fetidus]